MSSTGVTCDNEVSAQHPSTQQARLRSHKKFRSCHLETERDLLVFLPPGYDTEPDRRYPVLYLHDGQNLFDPNTSFIRGRDWRAGKTAQRLIADRDIEPLIIVGVYNAGVERVHEYTPTRCARMNAGGRADVYGRFMVEELKPFVDSHYRTQACAPATGLGGSSLGGLVSLYLGLKYPDVFGKLAVMSPSVWWDNHVILREVAGLSSRTPARIWLDMGTNESACATRDARRLRDVLLSKGWRLDGDLCYLEDEGDSHDEPTWARRVEPFLKFLYPNA